MRRLLTRASVVLVLLTAAVVGSSQVLVAAAEHAAAVDLHTVRAGSVAPGEQTAPRMLPIRADLLGASWRGSADALELRARGSDGRWSRWIAVHASADGPDPTSGEARSSARRVGARRGAANPVWVGGAERVQVRTHDGAALTDVRIVAINATGTATRAERSVSAARTRTAWVLGATAHAIAGPPKIQRREAWGAAPPRAGHVTSSFGLKGAVVHHTVGTNRYSCAQVPALLRGIQRYHQVTQGWNDIGYNFLVDRCGGVWEGRAGGIKQDVVGAHAEGFNTGTVGIALLGTHDTTSVPPAARRSLVKLLSWRMDVAHVKPTGKLALTAGSSAKFPRGTRVVQRAVSGHRDLFPTSCPGALAYRQLGSLASAAWASGGVKVANVTRRAVVRNPDDPLDASLARVNVRAVSSHRRAWLVARIERISTGELLHRATNRGASITMSWHVPAHVSVPSWDVRVVVDGRYGKRNRARTARFDLDPQPDDPGLAITTAPSTTVMPDSGDPSTAQLHLAYTLAQQYRLGAWLHDPQTGAQVATLRQPAYLTPTEAPAALALSIPATVPAGSYELRVGLPADTARGRSMHRFAVTVTR